MILSFLFYTTLIAWDLATMLWIAVTLVPALALVFYIALMMAFPVAMVPLTVVLGGVAAVKGRRRV